jgi:oxygen-dependent protoporphyrinogen oxidase
MTRIAILGAGISGLTAAYELEKARKAGADIDWHLYESTDRLGGIMQTTQHDGFTLEGGPDGWVTEKPWATELANELGLQADLIASNDATRKTYILLHGKLQAIPDGMRMMVPTDLSMLENSPLFSATAKHAYAKELANGAQLKQQSPDADESVATFVHRHFGEEVLTTLAAPLLSGVFGGDVHKLSVRSVMPQFVAMEREHGSLIAGLQSRPKHTKPQAIFTSLRNGIGSLADALAAELPADRVHLNRVVLSLKRQGKQWLVRTTAFTTEGRTSKKHFHHILCALPVDAARQVLTPIAPEAAAQLPTDASSAILAALAWPAESAAKFTVPQGFGFLVPQQSTPEPSALDPEPSLLACTFVDQKFPHRAPPNARILRAFFGGPIADALANATDEQIAATSLTQLEKILGPLPSRDPSITSVRRWPRSLPQYEVGHQARIAKLDELLTTLPGLTLLGNAYRGVGLPDLIRDATTAARKLCPA